MPGGKLVGGCRSAGRMEGVRNELKMSELNNRVKERAYQESLRLKYVVWRGGEVESVEEWEKFRDIVMECTNDVQCAHTLQSELESGKEARVVQIDFSAAFDRVNHLGILYKLCSVGILGVTKRLLLVCLANHTTWTRGFLTLHVIDLLYCQYLPFLVPWFRGSTLSMYDDILTSN